MTSARLFALQGQNLAEYESVVHDSVVQFALLDLPLGRRYYHFMDSLPRPTGTAPTADFGSRALPEDPALAFDLFAGAGGATQGLTAAGVRVVLAVESDPAAASSYRLNHPEVDLRETDIRSCDLGEIANALSLAPGALTLIKACPPCQRFSSLAKTAMHADSQARLVLEPFRWISFFRPRIFTLENVPGLRRAAVYAKLLRQVRGLGYRCRDFDVDAADFDVPQRRRRLILVGIRSDCGSRPSQELAAPVGGERPSAAAVLAALASLSPETDALHVARASSPIVLDRIRAVPVNGSRFDLPPQLQLSCHKRLSKRNATEPYGRIPSTGPAATMTTRCTTPSCGQFIHPTLDRGISLREASLLQTFPPNYRFSGTYEQIEKQIGNAVPVKMVQILTERVLDATRPIPGRST